MILPLYDSLDENSKRGMGFLQISATHYCNKMT